MARPDVPQVFAEDVLSTNLHLVGFVIITILKKNMGFKTIDPFTVSWLRKASLVLSLEVCRFAKKSYGTAF